MKFLLLTLVLSFNVFANSRIFNDLTYFNKTGVKSTFQWAPARYNNNFRYDIFYYIPEKLKNTKDAKALVFNHGGGGSTMDRAGSIRAVNLYFPDLQRLADELGIIVVAPSANGLNWGGHTRGMLRELVTLIRTHLNVDSNHIGLSGHSMGGMGITRNYLWTADEFSFYLPMAAGMDEKHQTEAHLNKVFNVPYVHLQGKRDHFDVFITRSIEQEKRTNELEQRYGRNSKFELIFYDGDHQYNYSLFKAQLAKLLLVPRNLFQKNLYGSFHTTNRTLVENNIEFNYDSEARYFWLELANSDLTEAERVDFQAKIEGNDVLIDMPVMPAKSKQLKIYLSQEMINLNKPINIVMNGQKILKVKKLASLGLLFKKKIKDLSDPGFIFDRVIEVDL